MVNVGTGTSGTRFINKDYPITEGLTAGTTKLKDDWILDYEETKVKQKDREGI